MYEILTAVKPAISQGIEWDEFIIILWLCEFCCHFTFRTNQSQKNCIINSVLICLFQLRHLVNYYSAQAFPHHIHLFTWRNPFCGAWVCLKGCHLCWLWVICNDGKASLCHHFLHMKLQCSCSPFQLKQIQKVKLEVNTSSFYLINVS